MASLTTTFVIVVPFFRTTVVLVMISVPSTLTSVFVLTT